MPTWNEYKEQAKERGSLAMELYAVRSKPIAEPEMLKATLPAHLAYQAEQEANGTLFLAGPLSDETGEMMFGEGLIIYQAESLEAATAIAEADPMHKERVREFEIRRWMINEGGLSLTVRLSGQSVRLES